jgi:hypothetical protein
MIDRVIPAFAAAKNTNTRTSNIFRTTTFVVAWVSAKQSTLITTS